MSAMTAFCRTLERERIYRACFRDLATPVGDVNPASTYTWRRCARWYSRPDGNLMDRRRDAAMREAGAVGLLDTFRPLLSEADKIHRELLEDAKLVAFHIDHERPSNDLRKAHKAVVRAIKLAIPALTSQPKQQPDVNRRIEQPGGGNSMSEEAKALATLAQHPDWPDTRIAESIGCNRTSLYRMRKFKAAKKLLRAQHSIPRGSKDRESGRVEAIDEE